MENTLKIEDWKKILNTVEEEYKNIQISLAINTAIREFVKKQLEL
jgi:hypothetical protein